MVQIDNITDETLLDIFTEAKKAGKLVIAKASAEWCKPCHAMAPVFAAASNDERVAQHCFIEIDVEECCDFTEKMHVKNVPTVYVLKPTADYAEVLAQHSGIFNAEEIVSLITNC